MCLISVDKRPLTECREVMAGEALQCAACSMFNLQIRFDACPIGSLSTDVESLPGWVAESQTLSLSARARAASERF